MAHRHSVTTALSSLQQYDSIVTPASHSGDLPNPSPPPPPNSVYHSSSLHGDESNNKFKAALHDNLCYPTAARLPQLLAVTAPEPRRYSPVPLLWSMEHAERTSSMMLKNNYTVDVTNTTTTNNNNNSTTTNDNNHNNNLLHPPGIAVSSSALTMASQVEEVHCDSPGPGGMDDLSSNMESDSESVASTSTSSVVRWLPHRFHRSNASLLNAALTCPSPGPPSAERSFNDRPMYDNEQPDRCGSTPPDLPQPAAASSTSSSSSSSNHQHHRSQLSHQQHHQDAHHQRRHSSRHHPSHHHHAGQRLLGNVWSPTTQASRGCHYSPVVHNYSSRAISVAQPITASMTQPAIRTRKLTVTSAGKVTESHHPSHNHNSAQANRLHMQSMRSQQCLQSASVADLDVHF